MENKQASMTAIVSAFGRAYHSLNDEPKIFDDFIARKLLTDEEYEQISIHMSGGIQFFNPEGAAEIIDREDALKWVIQNQIAPTPLARNRYCEDMLENAVMLGAKQYVILGAGLDTFAFRKPHYSQKINIIEVDHPTTQSFKLDKIKALGLQIPENLYFVPVDFTKDDFEEKMKQFINFDCSKRSFFSWLGVTYYLTKEDILKNLKAIVSLIPEGSSIVFDYADEYLFDTKRNTKRVQNMVAMAAAAGEPMKSCFSYSELEAILEEAGLLIYEHLTPKEIEERYFLGRNDDFHAFENTNFVLAVYK